LQNLDYYTYIDENDCEGKCYTVLEFEKEFEQSEYTNQLWLFINSLDVDESIENEIVSQVVSSQNAIFVAKRELDGWSEYYFYAKHSKGFKNTITSVIGSKYIFESGVNVDKNWTLYHQELMPDIFKFHQIEAKRTMDMLISEGDDVSQDRAVEHYMKFLTPTQRERAKNIFMDNEYIFSEESEVESDEYVYLLVLQKNHNILEETTTQISNEILDIVLAEHGEYIGFSTVMASE